MNRSVAVKVIPYRDDAELKKIQFEHSVVDRISQKANHCTAAVLQPLLVSPTHRVCAIVMDYFQHDSFSVR